MIQLGDEISVHALHADGEHYRGWHATVEYIDHERIVTTSIVDGRKSRGHYWFDCITCSRGSIAMARLSNCM